jgi:hypothetical protein
MDVLLDLVIEHGKNPEPRLLDRMAYLAHEAGVDLDRVLKTG